MSEHGGYINIKFYGQPYKAETCSCILHIVPI